MVRSSAFTLDDGSRCKALSGKETRYDLHFNRISLAVVLVTDKGVGAEEPL